MPSVAFDTFKAAKRLHAAGFDEKQTNALVGAFASNILDGLASKEDLEHLQSALSKDMVQMEERQNSKLDVLRKDMTQMENALRKEITQMEDLLRKDMVQMEERQNARIDALRKDMVQMEERQNARIEKMLVRYATITVAIVTGVQFLTGYLF